MKSIRRLREAHGMTQAELGHRLGVTSAAVNKWEAGASVPRLPKLMAMARIFDCAVDALCDDPPQAQGEEAS